MRCVFSLNESYEETKENTGEEELRMVSNLRLEQLLQQGQRNAIAQNEFFSSYLTTYLQVPLQSKEINEHTSLLQLIVLPTSVHIAGRLVGNVVSSQTKKVYHHFFLSLFHFRFVVGISRQNWHPFML